MKVLIATTNPGKLIEITKFLSDLPIKLVNLSDIGITEPFEESGTTLKENAIFKAKYYCEKSGLPTIADDGGFEIDALGGEPGVKSHRWVHGSRENTDEELIAYTMDRMKDVPEGNRGAQLRLVMAFATPEGSTIHTSEDAVRGVIPMQARNKITPGFPYRSLLFLPEIGKFYDHDDMTTEETDRYNHRKKALEKLKVSIRSFVT